MWRTISEDKTNLQIEAHDGFWPALPHFARVFAFVIQDVGEAVVVSSESVLLLVEVASAPAVVVNIPINWSAMPLVC